jgi:hypothetical protein
MTAASRYTRAIASEVGDIERRLQALQRGIEKLGMRASSNARDNADGLSEAVASALSNWAVRFRQGAKLARRSICGLWQRCSAVRDCSAEPNLQRN